MHIATRPQKVRQRDDLSIDAIYADSLWAVPDQESVCRNLLAEELKTKASALAPTTPIVTFINTGIAIQEKQ